MQTKKPPLILQEWLKFIYKTEVNLKLTDRHSVSAALTYYYCIYTVITVFKVLKNTVSYYYKVKKFNYSNFSNTVKSAFTKLKIFTY